MRLIMPLDGIWLVKKGEQSLSPSWSKGKMVFSHRKVRRGRNEATSLAVSNMVFNRYVILMQLGIFHILFECLIDLICRVQDGSLEKCNRISSGWDVGLFKSSEERFEWQGWANFYHNFFCLVIILSTLFLVVFNLMIAVSNYSFSRKVPKCSRAASKMNRIARIVTTLTFGFLL